ncbi:MAG: DNA methyltransferase [Thaumarchaeota archaeon]|nr:DNA methyltransferase [Nitrososphaerota archaeon]
MKQKFLVVSAYGMLSLLELASLRDSKNFEFGVTNCSGHSATLEIELGDARELAKRLGGFYKMARICGESPEELLEFLPLPDETKFNWTISSYDCNPETLEETRSIVSDFLKSNSLGKSRFLKPESETGINFGREPVASELKLKELAKNVLSRNENRVEGLDVVVHCQDGMKVYGYTQFISDVSGYEKRDFSRSYQDPTSTLGPRLARVLVNLSSIQRKQTLLDPFCGLGTILQEAMMCGYNAVGVDISQAHVRKCVTNLEWFRKQYGISPKLGYQIYHADSMKLESTDIPPVDGIATEPILVPKLESNPTAIEASKLLVEVKSKYDELIRAFARFIRSTGQKAVLVVPEIVDDRGRNHTIKMEELMGNDFSLYLPQLPGLESENPCRVPTSKKKIVQRRVYVMQRL